MALCIARCWARAWLSSKDWICATRHQAITNFFACR
jgi:hypothetical protein